MDDLFNLDQVNTESLDDSPVDVPVSTDDPCWQVETSRLSLFLSLSSLFGWRSGTDLTPKSVCLSVNESGDSLICRSTDFDTYLEFTIPQTSTNPIRETLIFPTATFIKLVKLSSKTLTIKYTGSPSVLIMGQWIPIESITVNASFVNSDPTRLVGSYTVPLISDIIPILSSAVIPKDRNLLFCDSMVQSTQLWSVLQRKTVPLSVPFILTSREASLLKAISSETQEVKLYLTESDIPRLVIESDIAKLWLIYRKPESTPDILPPQLFSLKVEAQILTRLTNLSESLPNSNGNLEFNYTHENGLDITYCSKIGNTVFPIEAVIEGHPEDLSSSFIQTKLLKPLLKALGSGVLSLSWDTTRIYIYSDTSQVSIPFET